MCVKMFVGAHFSSYNSENFGENSKFLSIGDWLNKFDNPNFWIFIQKNCNETIPMINY